MGAEIETTLIRVSKPVKRRIDDMRDGMQSSLGRTVTLGEVLEALLAEHDKAMGANPI